MNYQLDLHAKISSIRSLKEKIKRKQEQLNRMKHRIQNIDTNIAMTKKNNILLEVLYYFYILKFFNFFRKS